MGDPEGAAPLSPGLTVAITGGTGFVGGAIIRRLLEDRVRIRALVRPASLSSCFEAKELTWIQGELGDRESLRRLVEGASAVIHCAGSVRGACPADFEPANVSGVERIVAAARGSASHPRLLLFSSLAARSPELSDYAASKRRGEDALRSAAHGLDWTILRPPAVYGPGDREMLPLLQWMRRGILFVPGGGAGRLSLIYVSDLAAAVSSWLMNGSGLNGCFELHDGKAGGYSWEEIRGVARELYRRSVLRVDIPRPLLELAARLNIPASRLFGYRPMFTPGKVRELCHQDWVCHDDDFRRAVNWSPRVGLAAGLRRTLG
jgi:nucleoside-diphosphate-sugar epimerase